MRKFKKFAAVLLSMVMLVCMFSVPASAKSVFDGAIKMEALEYYSKNFKDGYDSIIYKITIPSSGKLSFECNEYLGEYFVRDAYKLYDKNAVVIYEADMTKTFEFKNLKKGTYYLKMYVTGNKTYFGDYNAYFKNLFYTFIPDETPTISLALNVKVGDELDFSALATNYTGKCTWKSTKPAVASVDKGKVKALKVGKAKIRAYMNNGDYAEITLVVKKK